MFHRVALGSAWGGGWEHRAWLAWAPSTHPESLCFLQKARKRGSAGSPGLGAVGMGCHSGLISRLSGFVLLPASCGHSRETPSLPGSGESEEDAPGRVGLRGAHVLPGNVGIH